MERFLQLTIQELKLRNYSQKTIKSYTTYLYEYFKYKLDYLDKIDINNIKKFLLIKQNQNKAPQTVNLYLNAIKFFYRDVLKNPRIINIKSSKKNKHLPIILSRQNIQDIINIINNPKHKLIIALAYGAGLRVSEIINLKIKDIDLDELIIHIKESKGKKDRITIIPNKLKSQLELFIINKTNNNDLIFISERGGKLSTETVQKIFKNALKKLILKKMPLFIHCATALLLTC